jgi:ATP adenylyltransferase
MSTSGSHGPGPMCTLAPRTGAAGRPANLRIHGSAPRCLLEFYRLMNHIWSPWRMEYIENHGREEGCVFCRAQAMQDGPQNLIVYRKALAYVILNRYPYTSGHVMVVPLRHQPNLEALDAPERAEMMELTSLATSVLRGIYQTQAFNIGLNIGEAAGAGVKEHVHVHVVPRWVGDTNFMSTLAGTRVLPELLQDTWKRIKTGFDSA